MRHVGGEALDGLDAVIERVGHAAQGATEMADLVAAVGEIGDFGAGIAGGLHSLGGGREAPHGSGNGAGQCQRQRDLHRRGDQRDAQDAPALLRHDRIDVTGRGRQQDGAHHGAQALHRHRNRHDELVLCIDAHEIGRCA
jgi:hypothetical protein